PSSAQLLARRADTSAMVDLPSGTVTLLFTDIEGSTRLLHELGDRYVEVLADHRRALRAAVAEHHGVEVDTQGDAFFIAFANAPDAVAAARAAQLTLAASPVRVRMGIHTGTPAVTPEGYVGVDVHRGARICAAGHGGQILISKTTRDSLTEISELRDLGEHRLKDLQSPEWLFQVLAPDLEPRFPPLRSLSNTNLPADASKFIGRRRELAEMSEVLGREEVRLLTLTGAGGSGKTRLSIRLAAEFVEHFKNGVFLVSLAPVSDPARVLGAIAQTLGAKGASTEAPADTLRRHLEGKQVLLVLDNFEHLLAAASDVSLLLASAPQLKVIVTSRERLRLAGEHEFAVPPLPMDDAVTLFDVRARAAKPSFRVELDRAPVLAICRRLDGLPLAVELAAARVKVLGPQALLARLEQRLPVLTGGPRDMPHRQRTLRATIDWSYKLLQATEQDLFTRLAVFVGGFTPEAAEAVTGASLDDLAALLDQSLLRSDDGPDGGRRFSMFETIREYAVELLGANKDLETLRGRHAEYIATLAEFAQPQLSGRDQVVWAQRLEAEQENVRAAIGWGLEHQPLVAARLVAALGNFWFLHGQFAEARHWVDSTLALSDLPAKLRISALDLAGTLRREASDYARAATLHEEQLALARAVGDSRGIARSLQRLGSNARVQGDYGRAHELRGEAVDRFREIENALPDLAVALSELASTEWAVGTYERARALFAESLGISESLGDLASMASALNNLGATALAAGRAEDAREPVARALALSLTIGDVFGVACSLDCSAELEETAGHWERAASLQAASDAIDESLGVRRHPDELPAHDLRVAATRANLEESVFAAAWQKGRAMTLEQAVAYAITAEDSASAS
ncbi:MAG: hypothetical protein QOE87_2900, partial [Gaiellales bacterium]|nr:hypothetical protein [Gaiellales bacterium]